ncbi:MAG: hypothetical protein FJW34_00190 [Acidobacteria bacterium]|nr:hypothetical protein [Acidobacteriota bacterium]
MTIGSRYQLVHDLLGIPAGTIFELEPANGGEAYFAQGAPQGTVALPAPCVEQQPDWFKPLPQA